MNHETLGQAARKFAEDAGDQYMAPHAFKAGASWREQQAASGLQEWWDSVAKEAYRTKPTLDVEKTWQASQLSSAKLLAEKEQRIKQLQGALRDMGEALEFYESSENWNHAHEEPIFLGCDIGGKAHAVAREALSRNAEILNTINKRGEE